LVSRQIAVEKVRVLAPNSKVGYDPIRSREYVEFGENVEAVLMELEQNALLNARV